MNPTITDAQTNLYSINAIETHFGIRQIRCNYLAPVGFNWWDSGIPTDVVNISGSTFSFKPGRVAFTGTTVVDYGRVYGRFSARLNNGNTVYFWAVRNRMPW